MKKVFLSVLCLLLIAAMAMAVMADGSASFSMSASSKTLYRGDTVTLTANASSSAEATSYGLKISFDTSVFELVSGNTAASGALVNSYNNGFAFMFQTPTAYSGSVGTVTLKVKDNAPVGSYTITGVASVKNGNEIVSASGCSVSVTVSCHHSYGDWTDNGTNHQQTCSGCGDVKTADHQWVEAPGSVPATCKDDGIWYYTCSVCGAEKSEPEPKNDNHTFGNLTSVNEDTHKDTCSVCQQEVVQPHTWNTGTVTKPATCKEEGEKVYTCTGCRHTKTEKIEKSTTHTFGKWEFVDEASHKHVCTVCQLEESNTHNYKTSWSKDSKEHWHECADCKNKQDVEVHSPGKEATETTPQTCTVCNYIMKAALGHTHTWSEEWTTDESGHWYVCGGCDEQGSYEAHDYVNACDPDCSVCGVTRETGHTYGTDWLKDGENHWHECSGCGEIEGQEPHTPGAEATATTAQTCTVCGYELVPAFGEEETEPAVPDVTDPVDDGQKQTGDFPWWIIIVAVAAIGGIVILALVRKKK